MSEGAAAAGQPFRFGVRVYYEDTDTSVLVVWTSQWRGATVWTCTHQVTRRPSYLN